MILSILALAPKNYMWYPHKKSKMTVILYTTTTSIVSSFKYQNIA